ncbi:MAG: AAA family ATPase, partial [Chloroflexota bacterium]|nr:AAA family ATPase [Chloroflexota bacterium]
MRACPSCGESNPDRFSDCAFCGKPLVESVAPHEERKVLTVVFCDLKDSTGLGERVDPEALGEVLDLYFTAMTRVLQRHGGSIQKFIGDAIVAAFGIPTLHEDDALRAVRAATEMRAALVRLNRQLQAGYGVTLTTRTGVHTGEVVVRTAVNDQQVLTGDTLNTAARLEQAAGDDEILIGRPTYRLVREAIEAEAVTPLELKGKSAPVAAYRLLRVFGDEQAARRHDAPMVGREDELRLLLSLFDRAVTEGRCVLGTVLGDAGVGKSRLVRALLEGVHTDASVLRGRCLPYGEGITFWPLLTMVRDAAQIDADDSTETALERLEALSGDREVARRVASALGWSDEELPVAELFWGVRELFEHLARLQPLVVVIDDVHWAAPTLLELVEYLVENVSGARVLLLCTARPDMLESHPEWSAGPNAARLLLERLPEAASAQVLENMIGGVELPERARETVLRAADGNPLFVEQLVSMLVDTGTLVEVDGRWEATHELSRLEVPPSIQALLSARLDLLDGVERGVVEPASVIGLEFSSVAVAGIAGADVREEVPRRLETMVRKRLVRPAPMPPADEGEYRFDH